MRPIWEICFLGQKTLSNWDVSNVTNCEGFSHGAFSWALPKPNFTNCNPYHS
jgi:hypothetical protein